MIQTQVQDLTPDELCACMRALATWGYHPTHELLEAVEGRAIEGLTRGGFLMGQLAELAWTYAQLGLKQR